MRKLLAKIFNRKLGGNIRAGIAVATAVGTTVAAIADKVDWTAAPTVIGLALIQAIAHYTPVGDKTP